MYNVNDVYKIVLYITGKNLQQGYVSPEDFNNTINIAQKSYVAYLLGNFQQYQPGRPVARVEFGQNAVLRQRLAPIIYESFLAIDGSGYSPYPSAAGLVPSNGDYLQADAMWSAYGYERIREVQQHYFYSIYNSKIDPIGSWPVYMIRNNGFQFAPPSLGQARISYVIEPPDMVWGYTLDGNGVPVYNPATSVQPVWDIASILEIIVRALRIIGVNLDYNQVNNYANQIQFQGQ
jgi:hypothetical protein